MTSNGKFAVYRMEKNTFLGDCLCVVYKADAKEMKLDGLTGPDIAIYIKTPKDIKKLNSITAICKNDLFDQEKEVILRLASECQFGTFGDSHCDCESQRIACLDMIKKHGQGIYVQMPQEGQGHGLFYKAQELQLQVHGFDPEGKFLGKKDIYEASRVLTGTTEVDVRNFNILKQIFSLLCLGGYKYTLVSSNPKKAEALSKEIGITISSLQDIEKEINIDNVGEYLAKIYKKSFALSDDDLRRIFEVIFNTKEIPERVMSLLLGLREDLGMGRKFTVNHKLLQKIADLVKSKKNNLPIRILDASKENTYREFQLELLINNEDVEKLMKNSLLGSPIDFAFEENYYYDLVYFKNTVTRNLKIRKKSRVGGARELIESRLIYKAQVDDNEYNIRNITINDCDVANLLSNSLEGYEVHYVPVFTHTYERNANYPDLTMLVKRYSFSLRTLSVMGKKDRVKDFLQHISEFIELKIIPDPTNIRTVNKDLSLEFDYDILADEELKFFKEFFKG